MIDAILREQILRHQEADEKLRPSGLSWVANTMARPYWFLDADDETYCEPFDDTAESLITMSYLKWLDELGKLWMVLNDRQDGFTDDSPLLPAAVSAWEAANVKQEPQA